MTTDVDTVIRRVLAGETNRYRDLVLEYQDMLIAYASFRLPNATATEEIVHQTFIRAYQQLSRFEQGRDFGIWLRAICKWLILAELKQMQRESRFRRSYSERIQLHLAEEAQRQTLEDRVAETDVRAALQECRQHLAPTAQQVLQRKYQSNQSVKEIADDLQRSVSWVTTTLSRARTALRECIERRIVTETA